MGPAGFIGAVGLATLLQRFSNTRAALLSGLLLVLALATYRVWIFVPDPIALGVGALLIWSGWYAGRRETGIARIWSYAAAAVGGYLALSGIVGIVLEILFAPGA